MLFRNRGRKIQRRGREVGKWLGKGKRGSDGVLMGSWFLDSRERRCVVRRGAARHSSMYLARWGSRLCLGMGTSFIKGVGMDERGKLRKKHNQTLQNLKALQQGMW